MQNENIYVLNEINKGSTMRMDSIHYVSDKVNDQTFKKVLDVEYNKYKKIHDRVHKLFEYYSDEEPTRTNTMNKMMLWSGIQMKTMANQSNSKISELLMQGTNMGIIEGRKLLNEHSDLQTEVAQVLNDFVVMQEDSVETLKKYL